MPELRRLNLGWTNTTDVGLVRIASSLKNLEWLSVAKTRVTDKGVANLGSLHNLRELHLNHTRITGRALHNLKNLKHLEKLSLIGTAIVDDDIKTLSTLRLKTLELDRTKITDRGLAYLPQFVGLRVLSVKFCSNITDAGFDKLREACPNLLIYPEFR